MSAPSSISRRRTFWPCGPVWCVTRFMPSIFLDRSLTSSSDFATFTPPPLPRPPAWICAFTTQTLPPSFFAASTASSTEKQANPRGVGTPKPRRISFPWYSWIFMGRYRPWLSLPAALTAVKPSGRGLLFLSGVPLRIPAAHRFGAGLERVAVVELEGLLAVRALLLHLAGEGLDRRGGQAAQHLGDVRAALHAAELRAHAFPEVAHQVEPDQLLVSRRDVLAAVGIGHRVRDRAGIEDVHVPVDGDAQRHVVDRLAGAAHARLHVHVVVLHVGEVRLEVEQPVLPLVALVAHAARVRELALDFGHREGHEGRFSLCVIGFYMTQSGWYGACGE